MIAKLVSDPQRSEREANQLINDFQSETAQITGSRDPIVARSFVFVAAFMIALAIILASILKIERVVTANGRVVADAPKILVQALDTSIVRSLNVREAQIVKKGDVLARLDPTFQSADVGSLTAQAEQLSAEIARLEAEEASRPFTIPDRGEANVLQMSIWRSRQAEYNARIIDLTQKIESDRAIIKRATEDAELYISRLGLVSDIEGMRKELEKKQIGSRLNSLLASDSRIEVSRGLAQAKNTILSAKHDMESKRAEKDVFIEQWKSEISKTLASRRSDFEHVFQDLTKAKRRQDMVDLKAVSDGVVLEVGRFSEGSVVQSGDQLMTFVPINANMAVDVDIEAADQGFVVQGQQANIKFLAYRFYDHGMAKGVVKSISGDSFAPQESKAQTPNRFYRAHIEIAELNLRDVPADTKLVPGMVLSADIVVGHRTIIGYLLDAASSVFSEGMREP